MESSVFIEWITEENPANSAAIQTIVDAASSGLFMIATSAWTIAEVHKRKKFSKQELTQKQSEDILPYFRESYIELIEVERGIAERAHALCREFLPNGVSRALKPGDALHIAAAEAAECDVILSYDPDFLKLKYTKIPIQKPTAIPKEAFAPKQPIVADQGPSLFDGQGEQN